jgi:hypothetical protein
MSQKIGEENAEKLRKYLDSVKELPVWQGEINLTAIAREAGLKDRQPLYDNEKCVELLEQAKETKGRRHIEVSTEHDPDRVRLERENKDLREKNESLYAEVHELRREIVKFKHIEEMLAQGKRVIL